MNTIKIYLKPSGSVAEIYKDFAIYQGGFNNVLVSVYVPQEIVDSQYHSHYENNNGEIVTNGGIYTAVKIGAIYTKSNGTKGKTTSYFLKYVKEIETEKGKFLVYERKMPKAFAEVAGTGENATNIVINVVNVLVENNNSVEDSTILSVITSQIAKLDILPSDLLDNEETIEPSELDLLSGEFNTLQQKTEELKSSINTKTEELQSNIDKKLDMAKPDVGIHAYTVQNNPQANEYIQGTIPISKTMLDDSIVQRQGKQIVVPLIPLDGTHATSKSYVDSEVSNKVKNVKDELNITINNNVTELNTKIDGKGSSISLSINNNNFVITAKLLDANGKVLSTQMVDLPLETMVVSGYYEETAKKVVLELKNGNKIEFSVSDLISGLQSEITQASKLNADLVDDSTAAHKFVTTSEKAQIQANASDINEINSQISRLEINKQDRLISGQNIKSINGHSLLGEGNLKITGGEGGSSECYAANPNLLINPEMKINQRGNDSYTGKNIYGPDRWMIFNGTIEKLDNGKCEVKRSTISASLILQYIENYESLKGKNVTLSVSLSSVSEDNLLYGIGICMDDETGGSSISYLPEEKVEHSIVTLSYQVKEDATKLAVEIISSSDYIFNWAKLEVGEKATPYSPRPYGEELALCQRYFQNVRLNGGASAASSTSALYCSIPLPVTMRTTPTIVSYNVPSIRGNGKMFDATSISINSIYDNAAVFNCYGGGNMTQYEIFALHNGDCCLDAEIY